MAISDNDTLSNIAALSQKAQLNAAFQQAVSLYRQGETDKAEVLVRQLIDKHPDYADGLHLLGHIAIQKGQYDNACEYLARATRINPDHPSYHCTAGIAFYSNGKLDDALASLEKAIHLNPAYSEACYYQGLALTDLGQFQEALNAYDRAIQSAPDYVAAHNNRGLVLRILARPDDAIAACEQAIQLSPDSVEPYINKANSLIDLGRHEDALSACQQAIRLQPDSAETQNSYGAALRNAGRHEEALAAYKTATEMDPDFLQAHLNYGNTLSFLGRADDAKSAYVEAIRVNPGSAEAYSNLGNAFLALGDHDNALASYNKALSINDQLADTQNNLGSLYLEQHMNSQARACFEKALSLAPDFAEAYYNLGETLQRYGETEQAITSFHKALSIKPSFMAAKWGALLSLPILYNSTNEIEQARERWIHGVRELLDTMNLEDTATVEAARNAASLYTNFYLNYQGKVDTEEQVLYGKLLTRIAHAAYPGYTGNTNKEKHKTGNRIRIGFVSSFFYNHSIYKTHGHWITRINKEDFHVSIFYAGYRKDDATRVITQNADYFFMTRNIEELIAAISNQNLDLLIYTDLGMEPRLQLVAALRLAPVQCNGGGHPVTSGLPSIDYFLGSALMEPADGDRHYSEKLVRLPNLASSYPYPDVEKAITPSGAIRGDNKVVYLNLQSLFKLLPQHDDIYPRIARQVPGSRFWFIGGNPESITRQFHERLGEAFHDHGLDVDKFCVIHPQMPQHEFFGLANAADIILDGITWSGNNSSLEALAFDKPIVTMPGATFRDRHSYAILKRICVTDTITYCINDYIEIAAKLGLDMSFKKSVINRLSENKMLAYEDMEVINGLEDFLKGAVRH